MTSVLSELPTRLHHNAYVCADQERTRHFYEDIVGLPLVATWIEQGQSPDFPGREISFAHTFFAIGDGGAPVQVVKVPGDHFSLIDPKSPSYRKCRELVQELLQL